jgi:predicted RNase H-like HicB family nuclease
MAVRKRSSPAKRATRDSKLKLKHAKRKSYIIDYPVKRKAALPRLQMDIAREEDGRWFGEVLALPGVLAYGGSKAEARIKTEALALRVIAERIEHGESVSAGVAARLTRLFVAA